MYMWGAALWRVRGRGRTSEADCGGEATRRGGGVSRAWGRRGLLWIEGTERFDPGHNQLWRCGEREGRGEG